MKKIFLISFFIVLAISCKMKQTQDTFIFGNGKLGREYIIYIPENIKPKAPLVFVLHGLGSSNATIQKYSQMDMVADKHGFAVCYPQGSKSSNNSLYTKKGSSFWNVGYETHKDETVDDIFFLRSLAMHLQKEYNLDPKKTFCTGMSNGGDMSYLLGCKASNIFKAIAPITGCMMKWIYDSCDNNDPISVFQIHGTKDNITYYDGDIDNKYNWGSYMGVESAIDFWVDRNQCTSLEVDTLPDHNKKDGSYIISEKYINGFNKNEVWFYKIINGGHDWPQISSQNSGNKDINTSEEIWKFFQKYIDSGTNDHLNKNI